MAEKTVKSSSDLSRPAAKADAGAATRKTISGKKAVIATGGKQYLVSEGDTLEVELLPVDKNATFEALLVIDGDKVSVGTPVVEGVKVTADILEQAEKGDKVVAIRYKAKKRVRKVRGHRQLHTKLKISKIA